MVRLAVALALVAAALLLGRLARLRLGPDIAVAVARAGIQLGIVAVVIEGIFDELGWSTLFVVVMFGAATYTSGRRLAGVPGALLVAGTAIAVAAVAALLPLFLSGAFALRPRFLIPISGIVIGGAMTSTSLTGARLQDEFVQKLREMEARLALGMTVPAAIGPYLRSAVVTGLMPVIDQTKNVGIVTLPGAFVGMLLGGASPLQAAQVQLVVLFTLLGAELIAALVVGVLVARAFVSPSGRIVLPATASARGRTGSARRRRTIGFVRWRRHH